jgi:UDP:flavonoid glycosyltransferase YjiC (YdhE family)
MRRVKALGLGEALPPQELAKTPSKLFELIHKVAKNPSYQENTQRLQLSLKQKKTSLKAADLIDKYFNRN